MLEKYISAAEISEAFGISEVTIWRWKSLGYLPSSYKLGRQTRWKLSELQQWIAEKQREINSGLTNENAQLLEDADTANNLAENGHAA